MAQRVLGFIPAPAKVSYLQAQALRDSGDNDKLMALQSNWAATYWANLGVALAPREKE